MSIENIRSSLNALEYMAQNLGLDMQELTRRREALEKNELEPEYVPDGVNITSGTLSRLHASLGDEEPVSHEEALASLQEVRNASSTELGQVHGGLDPQRVFALLSYEEY